MKSLPGNSQEPRHQATELEYAAKLESLIAALGEFSTRVLRTLIRLIFRPRRLMLEATEENHRYIPPKTFLALSTFLSTTAIRGIIASVKVFLLAVSLASLGTCGAEYQPIKQPSILEMLRLPAISEVVFITLPTLAVVFLLARTVARMIARQSERSIEVISTSTYYIVGLQQILIALALLPLLLMFRLNNSFTSSIATDTERERRRLLVNAALFIPLLAPLIWPPILLVRLVLATIPRGGRVLTRVGATLLGAPVVCLLAAATVVATAYPFAQRDLAGRDHLKPYIQIRPATSLIADSSNSLLYPSPDSLFNFILTNTSTDVLVFNTSVSLEVWTPSRDEEYKGEIRSWDSRVQPFYQLSPSQSANVTVKLRPSMWGTLSNKEHRPKAGAVLSFNVSNVFGNTIPLMRTIDLTSELNSECTRFLHPDTTIAHSDVTDEQVYHFYRCEFEKKSVEH